MAPTLRFVNGHIELNQVARRVDGRWIGSRQEQNNFLVTAEPAAKISLAKIVMNQDTLNFSKAGWVHLQQVSPDSNVLHVQLQFLAPQGLRAIVGDTFTMGSSGTANTTPLHQVRISPFWIDSSLVTRSSFKALLGNDPSVWDTCAQCPVTSVTWFEAVRYCNARSLAEGREIAYDTSNPDSNQWTWIRDASGYRLPTEAEFEYAERAGTSTDWFWGETLAEGTIALYAWDLANSGGMPHPVASLQPNSWGLYDMAGNAWEWNWDWASTVDSTSAVDPTGPSTGGSRVIRGGGWDTWGDNLASEFRGSSIPTTRYESIGFRTVVGPRY